MLTIQDIEHFDLVPDYTDPMDAERPSVVITPRGHFCIDGMDMVEEARSKGLTEVECDVEEITVHSDAELCLRKMASRSRTKGGKVIYTEQIRNTANVCALLLATEGDIRLLGHGGRRTGNRFTQDKQNNARQILATRLGKDRDTINDHISYAEHLSPETLERLIAERMPKKFFEKFNSQVKQRLQSELQQQNADAIRISREISEAAVSFITIFKNEKPGKNSTRNTRRANQDQTAAAPPVDTNGDNNDDDTDEETDASRASEVSETTPAPDDDNSLPAIKQSVRMVAQRITAVVEGEVDINEMVERLRNEMVALQALLTTLTALRGGV